MKKPGQKGSPKTYLQKGELTSAEEMERRENGQKLAQSCVHGLFVGQGGERKNSLYQSETPRMAEGKTGKYSKCSLSLSKGSFTLSPIKAICGGEEDPSPRRVCFYTREASPI